MAAPCKPNRPEAWLTKQQMANALDMTVAYFDREVRRHVRSKHVREDGRRLYFYSRGVLDAWYESRRPQMKQPAPLADDLDYETLFLQFDSMITK